jgi:hypothetical protein
MPEAIVDRFEVITVDIRDREGLAIPPAPNQLGRRLFIEGGPIRQRGQRIVLRHALFLIQGVLELPKRKDNDANETAIRRELPEHVSSSASGKDINTCACHHTDNPHEQPDIPTQRPCDEHDGDQI